jgi:peptide/nickel transport system substrate-binding protein
MLRLKKFYGLVAGLMLAGVLVACGDNTATTAPAATTVTSSAANTTAATSTTAASTAANSTAATSATTAPAATTASGSATTAGVDANGIAPAMKYGDLPAGGKKGGNINIVSFTKQLTPDLHPYPSGANYTDSWTDVSSYLFGSTLLDYDAQNLRYRYGTADKLTISPDGKTYTFTLRPDIKWSDGSTIIADDYAYAVEQAGKEDTANPDNNYVGLDNLEKIQSFTASGNTITCTLKEPLAKNLALSYCAGSIFPVKKSLWSQYPFYDSQKNPEILKPTAVSGPYKLKEFKLDERIVLEVNPNYYKGLANFDTLTFVPSAQPNNAYDTVKAGQNQYALHILPTQYNEAKTNPAVQLFDWSAANDGFRYIQFNVAKAPFNDKALRQAVAYATDRNALLKATDNGLGAITDSFVLPSDKNYYNTNVTKYNFSLDKARQVLKDAGYTLDGQTLKDKSGNPVKFTVVYPTSSNPRKLQATYLQQQMKQLGIEVNVDGQEFNVFVKKTTDGDYDLSLGNSGGGTPPDPDGFKAYLKTKDKGGTQNGTGYSNQKLDDLFDQGIKELDNSKRREIYNQIQQIVGDDLPYYFLYSLTDYSVVSKDLTGIKSGSLTHLYDDEAMSRWAYKSN